MIRATLIALAVLTTFDAVAWQGYWRTELFRQFGIAASQIGDLDWTWE